MWYLDFCGVYLGVFWNMMIAFSNISLSGDQVEAMSLSADKLHLRILVYASGLYSTLEGASSPLYPTPATYSLSHAVISE